MIFEPSHKFPPKPSFITRDPIASAEWDRICEALRPRSDIVEVGEEVFASPALMYAAIMKMRDALRAHGRGSQTVDMAFDCDELIGFYLARMAELGIEPGSLVRTRSVGAKQ